MNTLIVGIYTLPMRAMLDFEQSYEPLGGQSTLRAIDGSGIRQTTWHKTRTTISGGGWLPPGLATINPSIQHELMCAIARSVTMDASRQARLVPDKYREDADHTPWAVATMPDHSIVKTPAPSIPDGDYDLLTADEVEGATGYHLMYYPRLTCWVDRPTESGSLADASYRWEMVCEEV
ncbi:hypothetical protein [Sphingopyxis sp.]|uniref:hypothetical protein n=1 Tax=Sphingopyxis sp. TaxID=1908224 RepID=UPI0025DCC709|nr:hypothetical protein [Sphingopyxis sp.]MBK6414061.1 hypothetical protein [Sphingopyxis sp.]